MQVPRAVVTSSFYFQIPPQYPVLKHNQHVFRTNQETKQTAEWFVNAFYCVSVNNTVPMETRRLVVARYFMSENYSYCPIIVIV